MQGTGGSQEGKTGKSGKNGTGKTGKTGTKHGTQKWKGTNDLKKI